MAEQEHYERCLGYALVCPVLAVDTEGTSITDTDYRDGSGYGFGISISGRRNTGDLFSCYYPIRHSEGNVSESMRKDLSGIISGHPVMTSHNLKHDVVALETLGIKRSLKLKTYCTLLMQQMINENVVNKSLDALGKMYCGRGKADGPDFQLALKTFGWTPHFPVRIMEIYASVDAELHLEVFEALYPYFKKQGFDG